MARTRHALIPLTIVTLLQFQTTTASTSTSSIPSHLRDDISAFIPACAEQCLVSFLTVNYARGDDSDQYLSLDFVCANRGRSGYTIGEGALQCLTGEKEVGFCSKSEAGDIAFKRAYTICDDKPSVAKPNSGVITATLKFGPESGVLTFAPITSSATPLPIPTATKSSTTSSSTSSSSTDTTLSTATSTSRASGKPLYTLTPTGTAAVTTPTPTPTQTQDAPTAAAATAPLSKGQIAGISIGAVCLAAGVAFGLILLVRYLLRRRRRHSGSSIASFAAGGGGGGRGGGYVTARDTWGYGFDKTSRSNNSNGSGRSSWITRETPGMSRYPPMQGANTAAGGQSTAAGQNHLPYTRESWRPSAIGLAISPSKQSDKTPTPTPTRLRPLSKLLPAKPDMPPAATTKPTSPPRQTSSTMQDNSALLHPIAAQFMRPTVPPPTTQPPVSLRLVIPDGKPAAVAAAHDKGTLPGAVGRDSALTEFEEDDLRRSTSPAGQIWCPPPSATAPDSAAAPYYVADGRGNWVLGDTKSVFEKEMQSPLSAAPRIATATAGIVTTAVQTQILAPRRSREPLAVQEGPLRKEEREWLTSSPQELAATPLIHQHHHHQQQQNQQQQQEDEIQGAEIQTTPSMTAPKTPRMRSVMHTPKTMPSPLFSRQPNPRSVSQPLPRNGSSASAAGRSLTARPMRSRATSADSGITTFSISSDASDDGGGMRSPLPTPGQGKNLSPVAESPRSRATASNTGSNATVTEANPPAAAVAAAPVNSESGGVSPVSYPRIPGRSANGTPGLRGRATFSGMAPRPPRMSSLASQHDMGQPSPTLGIMMHHGNVGSRESFQRQPPFLPYGGYPEPVRHSRGGGMPPRGRGRGRGGRGGMMMRPPSSQDVPPFGPPLRPPSSQQSFVQGNGSPITTMRMVEPSPEPELAPQAAPRDDRALLPSSTRPQQQPRRRPPSHLPHPFPMYPQPRAARQAQPPPPQQQEPTIPDLRDPRESLSRYPGHPMPMPQPYRAQDRHSPEFWRQPSHAHHPQQQQQQPLSAGGYNPMAHDNSSQEALATSPSSSLLAKRLGSTRAANMALPPQNNTGSNGRMSAWDRWQQQKQGQESGQGGRNQAPDCPATPDLPSTPTWLPSTPTWLPRLTPTRRGTDLVLNVG